MAAGTGGRDRFLSSGGNANSIAGDGTLAHEAPGDDRPDVFLYDPFHPVPTVGGQLCCYPRPRRLRPAPGRSAVRRPRSDPPPRGHRGDRSGSAPPLGGTSAPDTDFTGKLVDIYPDGYARNLTDGIIRARYRGDRRSPARPVRSTNEINSGQPAISSAGGTASVCEQQLPRFDRNLNSQARRGRGDAAGDADDLPRSRASVATGAADRAAEAQPSPPPPPAPKGEEWRMRGTHPGRSRFQPRFLLPIRRIGLIPGRGTGRSPASPRLPWLLPARLPSI